MSMRTSSLTTQFGITTVLGDYDSDKFIFQGCTYQVVVEMYASEHAGETVDGPVDIKGRPIDFDAAKLKVARALQEGFASCVVCRLRESQMKLLKRLVEEPFVIESTNQVSIENLAVMIYDFVAKLLEGSPIQLLSLTLSDGLGCSARCQ